MLKGMKTSILGDSISTYIGVSDSSAANSSTKINPSFYRPPFPLEKTYWMRVISELGLELCVNNSWSGGNLSGADDTSSGVSRAKDLATDSGAVPELIILFMGLNDLGRGISPDVFATDYGRTLQILKERYPKAKVCCVNLPDRDIFLKERAIAFNTAIANAVRTAGRDFFIADLFNSRLNNDCYYDNTLDGLHPDEDGMRIIAEILTDAITRNLT